LPILGNRHPSSPVENGVSGFLSDEPAELRMYALRLLENAELARKMGEAARESVGKLFSHERFRRNLTASINTARLKWKKTTQGRN